MSIFWIIFDLAFLGVWVYFAAGPSFSSETPRGPARWLSVVASTLLIIGGIGFTVPFLASAGAFNWLPNSFEWPVWDADGVVTTTDGLHVVPHEGACRVQVYDSDWVFIRGWQIDTGGGTLKVIASGDNRIEVVTARGNRHYVFTTNGDLLSERTYEESEESYSSFPDEGMSVSVPTSGWLWAFAKPLHAWFVIAAGVLVMFLAQGAAGVTLILA